MAKLIEKKLAGSTLIEVLIAMVIIMIVFTIAIKVFNNVLSSGISFQKVKVQNQLNLLGKQVKTNGFIIDEKLSLDSVDYELASSQTDVPSVEKLEISAKQHGKLLGSLTCLYRLKNETQN